MNHRLRKDTIRHPLFHILAAAAAGILFLLITSCSSIPFLEDAADSADSRQTEPQSASRAESPRPTATIGQVFRESSEAKKPSDARLAGAQSVSGLSPRRQRLYDGARRVLGRNELTINGKGFPLDCTGVVMAIYWYAGIDITKDFSRYQGNGVRRLYMSLRERGLLYDPAAPQIGDIIFWDNTYDRNRDGKWNDELTHVGMVVRVYNNGTVDYIHHNYVKGVVLERMTLNYPDTHILEHNDKNYLLNSQLRMKRDRHINPAYWLSSHLYRAFGRGYEID
ncbi:MAG: CHAP domain-containing protein [Spirochaetales bacterium]|nr:CHAP domain-containing protein [Spirochaetales bacterium]MCF7939468.1 CHAP domain-containing protein [Spirochaetales bacterium]